MYTPFTGWTSCSVSKIDSAVGIAIVAKMFLSFLVKNYGLLGARGIEYYFN